MLAKIKKIDKILPKDLKRYDIVVEHTHCFFANGILVHNSSAHLGFQDGKISYFSGGEKHENFVKIFDEATLLSGFEKIGQKNITIYGEVYGGKCQGMSETYGKTLKFIAFEVQIEASWMSVPEAEALVKELGLEFVHYRKIPTTIEALDAEMLLPSVQAERNGCGTDKKREGIVLRPLIEVRKNSGERIMAKHKREDFQETKTERKLETDPAKLKVLEDAEAIANEWVTEMRLSHVLQKFPEQKMEICGELAKAMLEDVIREGKGEIVDSKEARKAISKRTIELFKARVTKF
jgi:hypothetical protein